MRGRAVMLTVVCACAAVPGAEAATTIGPTPVAGDYNVVGGTFINHTHPTATLSSPIDGVIVRWRAARMPSGAGVATMQPHAVRPVPGVGYRGLSIGLEQTVPEGSGVSTFPTRLAIAAGDRFGFNTVNGKWPVMAVAGANIYYFLGGLDETPKTGSTSENDSAAVNADVEPDADRDAYGDESQDLGGDPQTFAAVPVGQIGAPQTITLTARSTTEEVDVKLTGANVSDFLISEDTCSSTPRLEVGKTCRVSIRFAPSATGARAASLDVTTPPSATKVQSGTVVTLSGDGVAATAGPAGPAGTPGPGGALATAPLAALLLAERTSVRRGRTATFSCFSTDAGALTLRIRRGARAVKTIRRSIGAGRTRLRVPTRGLRRGRYKLALEVRRGDAVSRDTGTMIVR